MPRTAPAVPAAPHPRQLCQMANCPHLRRQRRFDWAAIALIAGAAATGYFVPTSPVSFAATMATVAAFMIVGLVPPVRRYFGFGQHTVLPDEREALIDAYSQAATLNLLRHWLLPAALVVALMTVFHNKLLLYCLIAVHITVLFAPGALKRFYYNTRM